MIQIAFLGPHGTFSEEAAQLFAIFCGKENNLVPYAAIYACAEAVENTEVHYAVVPMENSLEGSVNETLDLLMASLQLTIVAELDLTIEHYLLSAAHSVTEIQEIHSHPQALAQCRSFLRRSFPDASIVTAASTAQAATEAARLGAKAAAVAGRRAAEYYGLGILAEGISDARSITRFVVLAADRQDFGAPKKTSLVFTVKNAAGSLYQVLRPFAEHKVNLTRIESRPAKSRLGEYIFFVDIDGNPRDSAVRAALKEAGQSAVMLKLLGTYPVLEL